MKQNKALLLTQKLRDEIKYILKVISALVRSH